MQVMTSALVFPFLSFHVIIPFISLPDPGTRIAPRWCWCTGQRRGAPRPQSASRQPQTVGRRSAGTKEGPAGARRPGGPQGPLQCGYPASPQRELLPARGRARAALAGREAGARLPLPAPPPPLRGSRWAGLARVSGELGIERRLHTRPWRWWRFREPPRATCQPRFL